MARNDSAAAVLAAAVAAGNNLTDAATKAGISRKTATRWNATPEFRARVDEIRSAAIAHVAAALAAAAGEAVEVLRRQMTNQQAAPASRIRAASAILSHLLPLREHAVFDARLDSLEAALAAQSGPDATSRSPRACVGT